MTRNNKKNRKTPPIRNTDASPRTRISGTVLDRLIKEKMARTPECAGVTAMPVVRDPHREGAWRVPGYTGEAGRVARCEAAIQDYLQFLESQFDLSTD